MQSRKTLTAFSALMQRCQESFAGGKAGLKVYALGWRQRAQKMCASPI